MQEDSIMNCPQCQAKLVKKEGRYGPFMGCPNFPCCKGFASKNPQEIYHPPDYSEFDEEDDEYLRQVYEFDEGW